ncbi:uncharacterized protein LOC121369016 [Gigantopelta aegis]|uniref:uncharacterized protein LOC121369016 n=1 Tax=Gigantopelta aegis TaxID=1735272 RepID=UPI001B88D0CC|nr:uncharacterized protein LOC121369016 [Gigantopelta aegis]
MASSNRRSSRRHGRDIPDTAIAKTSDQDIQEIGSHTAITKTSGWKQQQQKGHPPAANIVLIQNNGQLQIGNHNIMFGAFEDSDSDDEGNFTPSEKEELQKIRNCNDEVTRSQLQDIAQKVGDPWRLLMNCLGIPGYKVDQCYEENYHSGMDEVKYQLLRHWKQQTDEPTVAKLLKVLEQARLIHLWECLKPEED